MMGRKVKKLFDRPKSKSVLNIRANSSLQIDNSHT